MKLYISSDNQNQAYVDNVRQQLEAWGHDVCILHESENAEAIMKDSDIIIGILSKSALNNMSVYSEWNWSIVHQHEHDTRLLLLRLDNCIIPAPYAHIARIDVHTIGEEQGLQELQKSLQAPDTFIPKLLSEHDEFQEYLVRLYSEVVHELDFLIIPADEHQQALHMSRTYINKSSSAALSTFEQGFELHKNRAFLVGNPGVGKTISLLLKARDAILLRLQDSSAPLPILGYVVTWKALENTPLHIWLAKYTRIPAQKLQEQLENETCILLFDAVDDLGSSRGATANSFDPRQRFLDLIQKLPPQHQILITWRADSFTDFSGDHPLNGVITLEDMSEAQIEAYLTVTPSNNTLWEKVQQQANLLAMLRLPLMLGIFAYAYHNATDAVQHLENISGGALRDAIFDRYVLRRFKSAQRTYHQKHEQPPFTLEEIYDMLGKVAKHGAVKYGTGEVAFVTPEDERYGYWIAIEDMSFGFVGDENVLADEFVRFASELHIINLRLSGTCTFTHRLMRNYFVCKYCLPVSQKIDTYAIEALGKIADDRVPSILLEVINGTFPDNIKQIARLTYEAITGHRFVND